MSVGEWPPDEGAGGSGRWAPLANSVGPTEQGNMKLAYTVSHVACHGRIEVKG